jgi:hypothetical protein
VTTGSNGEKIIRVNFREHSHGLGSRATDQLVAAISSVLRGVRPSAGRPAVVIATVPGIPSVVAGWALARWHRARFVVEMRDAWPDLIEPSGILLRRNRTGGLRRRLRDLAARAVHRTVTRIQTRADLVARPPRRSPRSCGHAASATWRWCGTGPPSRPSVGTLP